MRSPVWAWHDPRELEPGGDFEYMDQGRQRFRVRLVPHAGDWRDAGVVRLAAELNQPPFAMLESYHDGPLAAQASYASTAAASVVVTVLKRAEDGDGFVVRGVRDRRARDAHVRRRAAAARAHDRGRLRRERDQDRSSCRATPSSRCARRTCSSCDARSTAATGSCAAVSATSGSGTSGPDKPWDAPGWLPARVPGSVLDDLVRAGEVPSPYHERDSRARRVGAGAARGSTAAAFVASAPTLRFDGVDHACTVLVDGREVATHAGMFAPFDVDVSAFADGGEHLLAVVVHPAPQSEPQVGRTSRVRVHKARMNYGWDFCPRLVHQGIWRSVVARRRPPEPSRRSSRSSDGVGTVEVDGEVVLRVDDPELWWPNGLGEQRLYRTARRPRARTSASARVELRRAYRARRQRRADVREGLELVPARPALRRAAPGEARAPAAARGATRTSTCCASGAAG